MDPLLVAAVALLTVAGLIVWWTNRPDRARLPDTLERRRMIIAAERHKGDV